MIPELANLYAAADVAKQNLVSAIQLNENAARLAAEREEEHKKCYAEVERCRAELARARSAINAALDAEYGERPAQPEPPAPNPPEPVLEVTPSVPVVTTADEQAATDAVLSGA